jgi:hypothetical protein
MIVPDRLEKKDMLRRKGLTRDLGEKNGEETKG